MWLAGLPAAVCGWKLEVIKRLGGNPPGREGAGYNGSTRPPRGIGVLQSSANLLCFFFAPLFRPFSAIAGRISFVRNL